VVKVICHKAHRRRTRNHGCSNVMRQVTATCASTRAHWCHLANTIELVHPSAHSSPQSKRQMDRFSRFCTAYGRRCLYLTMGTPIYQNCPFPWGIWTSHVTRDEFRPMRSHNSNGTSIGSAVFAQMTAECFYCLQWFACFPLKIAPSHVGIWTSCNTWFIGPTESRRQVVT